jgi:hypothetical protein
MPVAVLANLKRSLPILPLFSPAITSYILPPFPGGSGACLPPYSVYSPNSPPGGWLRGGGGGGGGGGDGHGGGGVAGGGREPSDRFNPYAPSLSHLTHTVFLSARLPLETELCSAMLPPNLGVAASARQPRRGWAAQIQALLCLTAQ